ncbi:Pyruvate kinase 2, cytosolic [Vitis vinifera]|uniref:pyruvate kinase n=1 Tax=Vitis vinifera TaxID=29760 RepID=A0A438DKZ9_VITVI|nr:Pyruvate kinase 2, cytosolic [Vitis vinifera]
MQGGHLAFEEPVRLSSVLTPSTFVSLLSLFISLLRKTVPYLLMGCAIFALHSYLPLAPIVTCLAELYTITDQIVGTLGPRSRSVETIEACLQAGMSVARFDFSWLDGDYHQETLENLRIAVKNVKKLCAVMLDTMGAELQVCNATGNPIKLKADDHVTITPDASKIPSAEVLPVNYDGLAEVEANLQVEVSNVLRFCHMDIPDSGVLFSILAIQDQVSFQHPYKVSSDAYQLAFKAYSYQGFPRNLDLRVVVQQLVKQIVLLKEDGQQSLQEQMPQVEEQLKHNNAQGKKLIKCYGVYQIFILFMEVYQEKHMRRKSKGLDYKEVEAVERVTKVREVKTRVGSYFRFLVQRSVKKGDSIFLGQYLSTGIESTSVWLEVLETRGPDVICLVKNSATLAGSIFPMHMSQVRVKLPTLTEMDKQVISNWGSRNKVEFIALSYTRHVEDVRELRAFLKTQNLNETQIFAKVETLEGLKHFDEILQEADGVILSRGNLGVDLPPERSTLLPIWCNYYY